MKCPNCTLPMSTSRENHGYEASGLPHVTLVGVEVRRCAGCGAEEVVIPKLDQLHMALVRAVIERPARLAPQEIRFLRKHLGWSGSELARHMGVTPESVSRWENAREPMGPVADRLLRTMVTTTLPSHGDWLRSLVDLNQELTPLRVRLEQVKGTWRAHSI